MSKEAQKDNGIRPKAKNQYLLISLGLSLGAIIAGSGVVNAGSQAGVCTFKLGFQEMAGQIPDKVGSCLDDESYDAQGNALQHTTGGLLFWRKSGNLTEFTNGYRTWIKGPYGLAIRFNSERFSWEKEVPDELNTPLYRGPTGTNRVALTFDDGYGFRKEILDVLNKNNTNATFCFIGEIYQSDPSFVDKAGKLGNEFCNHTYAHPNLLSLYQSGQIARIISEIDNTEAALNRANQTSKPYSRPPYWSTSADIRQLFADRGYRTIMSSLDPQDWRLNIDPSWLAAYVVNNAKAGDIIVLHTQHEPTLLSLQDMLTGLRNKGLLPGNLTQLISG